MFLFHHAISLFSELPNNNLLYLLWHSKLRVKQSTHLWFCKVLLVNSLQSVKAWQACAQQTEKNHSHTNSAVSRQVYMHALLVQHLQSVFLQYMIWYVPKSEKVHVQKRQKNWWKYTDCAELKKITIKSCSNCSIYSSLFFKFFKCRYFLFCLIEKKKQLQITE